MEFLRVAGGEAATPLAILQRDDQSLAPRAGALATLAATLTAQPWALTGQMLDDVRRQGLDEEQVEAAIGVISMFNYFTRVADATGIELDYLTPLPAFEPDRSQAAAPRPDRSPRPRAEAGSRPRPRHQPLRVAWKSWRAYVMESDQPISQGERRMLAQVAAGETADWDVAGTLSEREPGESQPGESQLAGFARKLSRQPWRMEAADLAKLRASGYREEAMLHMISVVAHQNADSRLTAGLRAAGRA